MALARTLTLTVALALGLAAPASATTWDFAERVARDYWQARGVVVPCDPTSRPLTDAERVEWWAGYMSPAGADFDMTADLTTCQVLVTPLAEAWRGDENAWLYCLEVVHEIGHLAGLGHDYGGVMEPSPRGAPFGCAHPHQFKVLHGWREPPRWVRRSPARVERLWLSGRVWRAKVARTRWLERR